MVDPQSRRITRDNRFSDTILIVCPNVTIRERLRELDPAFGDLSLYRTRQLVHPIAWKSCAVAR